MQASMGTRPQEMSNDALKAGLAYGTGGIFFHNNNDLTAGLREMMARSHLSGGSTPADAADNKYHHLKVRVTAAGHFDVQSRPGYVAAPIAPVAETPPRKIDEAALGSDPRTDAPGVDRLHD